MKVLQVITSLRTGGAEKLILDSVPIYQKKGIITDVLILSDEDTVFRNKLEKCTQGKIFVLTKGSVYNPLLIFKIIPYIKHYDIIHAHLFPTLYWVVLAKWISFSKSKIVYTEHSTHNKRRESKIFQYIDQFIYSKLDYIGCISEATKINLKKHLKFKKDDITVVLNGIELSNFINTKKTKFSLFDKNSFVLIQVSSFREQKDQPTLINALVNLPSNIKLLLVGEGKLRKDNEALVQKLGLQDRVIFLGNRNDIPDLMRYADVCILSSHYEGFGLAVLEGMAANKPVIASDVSGVKEIVENFGLLFDKGNAEDLANKIMSLYKDENYYQKIQKACFLRANDFDIEKMVDTYINEYKKAIK